MHPRIDALWPFVPRVGADLKPQIGMPQLVMRIVFEADGGDGRPFGVLLRNALCGVSNLQKRELAG